MNKRDVIRKIIADVIECAIIDVSQNASQDSVEQWDSLNHLLIITSLENTFYVKFHANDFLKLNSIDKIIMKIENNL